MGSATRMPTTCQLADVGNAGEPGHSGPPSTRARLPHSRQTGVTRRAGPRAAQTQQQLVHSHRFRALHPKLVT